MLYSRCQVEVFFRVPCDKKLSWKRIRVRYYASSHFGFCKPDTKNGCHPCRRHLMRCLWTLVGTSSAVCVDQWGCISVSPRLCGWTVWAILVLLLGSDLCIFYGQPTHPRKSNLYEKTTIHNLYRIQYKVVDQLDSCSVISLWMAVAQVLRSVGLCYYFSMLLAKQLHWVVLGIVSKDVWHIILCVEIYTSPKTVLNRGSSAKPNSRRATIALAWCTRLCCELTYRHEYP